MALVILSTKTPAEIKPLPAARIPSSPEQDASAILLPMHFSAVHSHFEDQSHEHQVEFVISEICISSEGRVPSVNDIKCRNFLCVRQTIQHSGTTGENENSVECSRNIALFSGSQH